MKALYLLTVLFVTSLSAQARPYLTSGYCYPLNRDLCESEITIHGNSYARFLKVTVTVEGTNDEQLFTCIEANSYGNRTKNAPWIQKIAPATFHLYESDSCYGYGGYHVDSLTVYNYNF